jgi:multicomponent Na+:H+ antiporter subunit E
VTRKWPVTGVALAVLWLFVTGVTLEPRALLLESVFGLGVGLPIAYGVRRLYTPSVPVTGLVRSAPYVLAYLLAFVYELVTANVDVAYRVLAPSMPIDPDVVEVPLRVESDAAVTTIANSITLTPGTLTMDYDPDRNALYVHALATDDPESVLAPIRRWEDYALRIFDETADPGDSPPDPGPDPDPRTDGGRPSNGREEAIEAVSDPASERRTDPETGDGPTDRGESDRGGDGRGE